VTPITVLHFLTCPARHSLVRLPRQPDVARHLTGAAVHPLTRNFSVILLPFRREYRPWASCQHPFGCLLQNINRDVMGTECDRICEIDLRGGRLPAGIAWSAPCFVCQQNIHIDADMLHPRDLARRRSNQEFTVMETGVEYLAPECWPTCGIIASYGSSASVP